MKRLEEKILKEGKVYDGGILKVGSFLNQQIDSDFMMEIGEEIARLYKNENITKVITVEASGIAIALAAGAALHVPAVFAKKHSTSNIRSEVYSTVVYSFTHEKHYNIVVSKEYIGSEDRVLIVDDFLARGNALEGLIDIVSQAGAELIGCAVAIEKGFQGGGDELRSKGIRVEALALIDEMSPDAIKFR
ncbi:MAG: xanthine phosphoribosyltransferase [Acutalibacteraceae bacterium]